MGPSEVKGLAEPVNVYEVIGAGSLHDHFELAARRGLTRFVGRELELAGLQRSLDLAMIGCGQLVAVVGEAGTGKSRLVHEFKAALPSSCKVLEAYSVSYGKASAWLPVIEMLRGYFGILEKDDAVGRREKVGAELESLDSTLCDLLPYVFTLLGIQNSSDSLAQTDGRAKKE